MVRIDIHGDEVGLKDLNVEGKEYVSLCSMFTIMNEKLDGSIEAKNSKPILNPIDICSDQTIAAPLESDLVLRFDH